MQLVKREEDVREFRKVSNKSGSSIENRLDREELNLREADKKRVAVVNSRADKGMGSSATLLTYL